MFDSDGGKANIFFTDITSEDNDAGPALLPSGNEESDKDENLEFVIQDWSDDYDAEYVAAEPNRKKIECYDSDSSSCSSFFGFNKQEFADEEEVFLFHPSQIIFKGMS